MLKVKVKTFLGEAEFTIDRIWFFNGKPECLFCHNENGDTYKFKMDEEPFEIVGTGQLWRPN